MDKKYLAELSSRDKSKHRKFGKELLKKNKRQRYPQFDDLKEPVIQAERYCYSFDNEKIWSQIPLAGSLILSIANAPKEMCLRENGFEPTDISKLIDLAKETNKIKFVLEQDPLDYVDLDYLDPIFTEFEPPTAHSVDISNWIDELEQKKIAAEFVELSSIKYIEQLRHNVLRDGGSEEFFYALLEGRGQVYEQMKILGIDDGIEKVSNLLVDNPEEAENLLSAYMTITVPFFDPLTPNYNHSLTKLRRFGMSSITKLPNIKIPELGKSILKKIVPNPTSYYGCIEVIQKYQDNDLYRLLESFEKALSKEQQEKIIENSKEIEEVTDNVWSSVGKMESTIKGIKSGISFVFGLGGMAATASMGDPSFGAISGLAGILSGLGFHTLETHFGTKKTLSEKIGKWLNPNYIVNVYDFKKKYNLS